MRGRIRLHRPEIRDQVVDLIGLQHELRHLRSALMSDDDAFRKCFREIADVISFMQSSERRSGRIWAAAGWPDGMASGAVLLDESFSAFDRSVGKRGGACAELEQGHHKEGCAELLHGRCR